MIPPAPAPSHRSRLARWALAAALILATGTVIRSQETAALGPVIPITPDNVIPNGFVGVVHDPQVSWRGEAVTLIDQEMVETSFVFLDNGPVPEPMVDGEGAAVSGDGCVALWARRNGSTALQDGISIGITDRCRGVEREVTRTNTNYSNDAQMALSFDGRFAAVQFPPDIGTEFEPPYVVRIDTATGEVLPMPFTPDAISADAHLGIDISDDGSVVAATHTIWLNAGGSATVALYGPKALLWDVASGGVGPLVAGTSIFPSLSANGRHVALTAASSLTGSETGTGPWVYAVDRVSGGVVRASAANGTAWDASISGDGSQVAYAAGPARCPPTMLSGLNVSRFTLERSCPTSRIDVAYGSAPGLTAGVSTETISLDLNGAAGGFHAEPSISWSGRWVTWVSNSGVALTGEDTDPRSARQAYLRERDGGLIVGGANFGPLLAGTSVTTPVVVSNVGVTSVFLDRLEVGGSGFAAVGGGTCVRGMSLAPGTTCTMNVRYTASATPGNAAGTVLAGEAGHDPLLATNALNGQSTVTPPVTTTTTTTTTVPTGRPTTTTTTTTTTLPGTIILDPQPRDVDFGPVAVGIGSVIQTITVTNAGDRPAAIVTVLGGDHPDDFFVSRNDCNGIVLQPGANCTVDVLMVALAGGSRTAVLSFNVPNVGGEDVTLRGQGRFSPRLLASPSAITERGLTTIIGQGFPNDQQVTVVVGDSGLVFTVQPDALGMFRIPLAAFPSLKLGSYIVRVDARPEVYELVQSALVVQLPTFQPQGPGGPAFGDSLLVTRG